MNPSPFPKLSQLWRVLRIGGVAFGTQALAGFGHLVWSDRAAIAAAAVAAIEAAYRQVAPSGKLANWVADVQKALAFIRKVDAKPVEPQTNHVGAATQPPVASASTPLPASPPAPSGPVTT